MTERHSIIAESLTKKFGDFVAVDHISFKVGRGEIFGFLGANGAGKTTAMKILTGLSKATSGTAIVAGYDVGKYPEKVKRSIGYMSQKFSLYQDLTVRENMLFYGGIYGLDAGTLKEKTAAMIASLGLAEESNTLVRSLPLGWRQKLAFATAILHEPQIVFLDEPTGGVDPVTRRQFWQMIYDAADTGITAFVTTHYMDEAEYCNRVAIMVDGRIEALDAPAVLKDQYHTRTMDDVFYHLARGAKRQ